MNRKTLLLALCLLIPLLAFSFRVSSSVSKDEQADSEIAWKDFEEGVALSAKEKKMLVIDIYTDWCHWCKVMDKDTYGNKDVREYMQKHAIFAKLNPEKPQKYKFKGAEYSGEELSRLFGVTGFPTTAFMSAKGELLTTISSFIPPEKFRIILEYLAENWYEKMKFDEFEKKQTKRNKN